MASLPICARTAPHPDHDVWKLREVIKTRLNLEMATRPEIVAIALKLKPEIICWCRSGGKEVTTEGRPGRSRNLDSLSETRRHMTDAGHRGELVYRPDLAQVAASAKTGAQFIELHTGQFANTLRRNGAGADSIA